MQIFFHVAVLPCMLAKGGKPLFCGRRGWYAFPSHIFPNPLHYFSVFSTQTYPTHIGLKFPHFSTPIALLFHPLTPLYPIPPSMYHTNNLPHIPHPHPSPLPVYHLRPLEPPTRPTIRLPPHFTYPTPYTPLILSFQKSSFLTLF